MDKAGMDFVIISKAQPGKTIAQYFLVLSIAVCYTKFQLRHISRIQDLSELRLNNTLAYKFVMDAKSER